jgi:hypothetical protein
MSEASLQAKAIMLKANRYCAGAIVCLSIALFIFGIGPFIYKPGSVLGIVSLCIGSVFVLSCYILFALYGRYSRQAEQQLNGD